MARKKILLREKKLSHELHKFFFTDFIDLKESSSGKKNNYTSSSIKKLHKSNT